MLSKSANMLIAKDSQQLCKYDVKKPPLVRKKKKQKGINLILSNKFPILFLNKKRKKSDPKSE